MPNQDENCFDIIINGSPYPFHFGVHAINQFSRAQKWDSDTAIEIINRLLTFSGSQKIQSDFHKMAATLGAITVWGEGAKPPSDMDIEDSYFAIVNVTQHQIYPALMKKLGVDVSLMLEKMRNPFQTPEIELRLPPIGDLKKSMN